jgi:hypothetical protein
MSWQPQATVTINGVDYTGKTLNGVSVTNGRSGIWEQARAGYANVEILNLNDTAEPFALNQSLTIKVKNSSNADVTIFTGVINDISVNSLFSSSNAKVAVHRIRAIGPFALMSRAIIGGTNWAKEYDDDRLDRIFTDSGVPVDIVDTPGVYEFTAHSAALGDAYTFAAKYASMAFGYIYETSDGEVGYANESRRSNEVDDDGYFTIPVGSILTSGVTSQISLVDVANDISLEYKANAIKTGTSAASIAAYGIRGYDIITELEQATEAQNQLDRYLALRAFPRISVSNFNVQLDVSTLTSGQLDGLIGVYMGKPIQVVGLPNSVYPGTYQGFVEGWTLTINRVQATLNITSTEAALSLTPTRWQDVSGTLAWSGVGAAIQWQDYE